MYRSPTITNCKTRNWNRVIIDKIKYYLRKQNLNDNIVFKYSQNKLLVTIIFLLIIGFFAISTFFKSYFVKFLFALIWFLPPEREIDITQLTLSIQYVFLFIGIYLISKLNRENHQINFKQHVFLLLAVFSMIIAIWDSDLAMVSIGIFILLHFYFLILDNSIKSIFKLADLLYL